MIHFRHGSEADTEDVLALMDANVTWLVEQGREDQWGTEAWSENPDKTEFIRGMVASGTLTLAERDGELAGASVLADHPTPYVPEIDEPEYYLKLLVVSPDYRGKKIGHDLITLARTQATEDGIELLRVDCWSGGDHRLVEYYIAEGFTPTEVIEVRPGVNVQVLEWRPD